MPKIKKYLHSGTSFLYNKKYKKQYQEFWQSSKILIAIHEDVYWKMLGYTIGNPIKHKENNTFDELKNNNFSSYSYIVDKYGAHFTQQLIRAVISIDENNNGHIDLKNLQKISSIKTPTKVG